MNNPDRFFASTFIVLSVLIVPICIYYSITEKVTCEVDGLWGYYCGELGCKYIELTNQTKYTYRGLFLCEQECKVPTPSYIPKLRIEPDILKFPKTFPKYTEVHSYLIRFNYPKGPPEVVDFFKYNERRFLKIIKNKLPRSCVEVKRNTVGPLEFQFDIEVPQVVNLNLRIDESYEIMHMVESNVIRILATTIFGARHALETVTQFLNFDTTNNSLMFRTGIHITDFPTFPYRGIMLDTSQNYITVDKIKELIEAMAMVKLNVFHWKAVGTSSFPLVVPSHEYLMKYGCYSKDRIYTVKNVNDIIKYAYYRGIIVMPELPFPSGFREGWQLTDYLLCHTIPEWVGYCNVPPCGQLDISSDSFYEFLEDFLENIYELFDEPNFIHMGNQALNVKCLNDTVRVTNMMKAKGFGVDRNGFHKLWKYFLDKIWDIYTKIAESTDNKFFVYDSEDLPLDNLDAGRYVVQITNENRTNDYISKNFDVVFSFTKHYGLSCIESSWVDAGATSPCGYYLDWGTAYKIDMKLLTTNPEQILGAEGIMYTDQTDDENLAVIVWPQALVIADIYWSGEQDNEFIADRRTLFQFIRFQENDIYTKNLYTMYHTKSGQHTYMFD